MSDGTPDWVYVLGQIRDYLKTISEYLEPEWHQRQRIKKRLEIESK